MNIWQSLALAKANDFVFTKLMSAKCDIVKRVAMMLCCLLLGEDAGCFTRSHGNWYTWTKVGPRDHHIFNQYRICSVNTKAAFYLEFSRAEVCCNL
jgi:hypothetical protein